MRPKASVRTLSVPEHWSVERLVPGGEGLCRLADGRIGFVPGGFPGDVLAVHEVEEHAGFARALRTTVMAPGPHRVETPCAFVRECGGCDWMVLSRAEQLEQKRVLVAEALRRTAHLESVAVAPVVTTGTELGYRRRVRLHVLDGRVGFYQAGGRTLVTIPTCVVAHPELQRVFDAFRAGTREQLAGVASIEARHATDGSVVARIEFREGFRPKPEQRAALVALGASRGVSIAVGDADAPPQTYALPGAVLRVTAGVFTQVNWEVNEAIVRAVVSGARERRVATFCDLFAGAGNFTLPLLAAGCAGIAVEQSSAAVACARRAATEAGLGNVRFIAGDAAQVARDLARRGEELDLVVLDPPRAGARAVLAALVALGPRHVVYVSCNPVTLARDARALVDAGYELESVTPFDMFPHTHHVEVVAWFTRSEPGSS